MKILRGTVAVACLAMVLLPAASAADTSRTLLRVAGAQFSSTSPDGCVVQSADVQAWTIVHRPPETLATESSGYFSLTRYNQCTGELISSISGIPELPATAFAFSDPTSAARLDVETVGIDWVSGSPVPVSLHLFWTNAVQDFDQKTASHFHAPGFISNYQVEAQYWNAAISGSLRANDTEYAQDPLFAGFYQEEGVYVVGMQMPHSAALAAAATATTSFTGNTSTQSGEDAQANWVSSDESGCVYTQTDVQAYNRQPGEPWGVATDTFSVVGVASFTYDYCTQTFSRYVYASQVLDTGQLHITLAGTNLALSLEGYDYVTGGVVPIQVDLHWSATGVPTSWQLTQRLEQSGSIYQRHVNQMWRNAEVSGTLAAGGNTLITGDPTYAVISTFDDRVATH
jgi:hypothetical protein